MGKPVLTRQLVIQLFDDFLTAMEVRDPTFGDVRDTGRALTPMEALMQTPPGEGVETSQMELLELRELLQDALEELDPEEQTALDATLNRQRDRFTHKAPLRDLVIEKPGGGTYSKSGVAKVRDRALEKLRARLENEPLVLEHIANNHLNGEE